VSEWKDKYLKVSAQQQEDAERAAENEQLLCRAIVRLTIAVHGLDKRLDPHLKSLQKAAKGGSATPAFQHRLSELSDALIKASEESAEPLPDLLERLISASPLKGRQLKQLNSLHKRLAADPLKADAAALDEFLQLLAPAGQSPSQAEPPQTAAKSGMLGRLLGAGKRGEERAEAGPQPNRQLADLLSRLDWPARLREDGRRIQDYLTTRVDEEGVWLGVVEQMGRLFSGTLVRVEKDLADTEIFLASLNARLQELDAVLQRIDASHGQSMASGRALREVVVTQVDGVQREASAAVDLDTFKQQLSQRLDVIQTQVVEHLVQEQERLNETSQESEHMRARMKQLEAEGEKLRRSLAEAQSQATTDALTGVPNRAAFEKRLAEEFARWNRFGKPLSMLVWDIDHFKSINDNFGHQAGDKTLRIIGQLLAGKIRETDFLARYGGEEFVMMMPGTPAEQAGKVANSIRETVARKKFAAGDKPIPLTISCGYCEFRQGEKPEDVFKRADEALYKAKQNGRNRCEAG
jgi:diguanylate cyclase